MNAPQYFLTMFGDPSPPQKDIVESGTFHPDPRQTRFSIMAGDIILLYCSGSYAEHPMEAPGLGVVLDADNTYIKYRYLPLVQPVTKELIEQSFLSADQEKFKLRRYSSHWLFDISKESFSAALKSVGVVWP